MKRVLLLACVGFACGFIASACGKPSSGPSCTKATCEGCCDATDVCRKGDQGASCGSAGVVCNVCSGGQVCLAAVCTLAHADGGSGGGSGGGTGGGAAVTDAGTPRCASTPVTCSDQISADLDLKATANVATLTNAAEGTGFKSTVDTRAGGVPPSLSYVYAVFTETGLQAVNLSDEAALSSLAWDIAFRRFVIRLNGGSSGPSCVDAAKTSAAYDPLIAPPAGLSYVVDDFVGPPGGAGDAGCAFKDDGSGLTSSPSTALASFYRYNNCVAMSGQVFVVRTRLGRDVKLTVTSYYDTEAHQTSCNTGTPTPGALGGTVRVRWSFLD